MASPSRLCFTIDLDDDPERIAEYERWHEPGAVWPEVVADLRASGYCHLSIWRWGARLIMVADREDAPAGTGALAGSRVEQWERLMQSYQRPPGGGQGPAEWAAMTCIFNLDDQPGPERPLAT